MILKDDILENSLKICGIDMYSEIKDKYEVFSGMMIDFNSRINITRITEPDDIIVKHIEDSLSVFRFIKIKENARYLDIGTGGGVPALPILIARPDIDAVLIDSVGKKLRFADSIIEKFGMSAKTIHIRAEEIGKIDCYKNRFDMITARAVTGLDKLISYAAPLLAKNGFLAAYKGEISEDEYEKGKNAVKKNNLTEISKTQYKLSNGDKRTLIIVK